MSWMQLAPENLGGKPEETQAGKVPASLCVQGQLT